MLILLKGVRYMCVNRPLCSVLIAAAYLVLSPPNLATAKYNPPDARKDDLSGPKRVMVLDGSTVHNAGQLLMHVSNWGMFGSMPNSGMPFAHAPSAEWPAGSGTEHLYAAGLWIAAIKSGVPCVSTSIFEVELQPTDAPLDTMYRTVEGAPGGNRLPYASPDDDGDGLTDEDWLDGYDNDGDGLTDEDFAAISDQMFSCWYTDDQPAAIETYPSHNPLHIMVRQESYQWDDPRFDDFVGIEFTISNIGTSVLENLYFGIFADCDIGSRDQPGYWEDDSYGFESFPVVCTDLGPAPVDIGYAYDTDGDGGQSPGYFGITFLGHPADPTGEFAPRRVGINMFAAFGGDQPYEDGGDPTNDFERYELMSSQTIERDATYPGDYRILVATGPFAELLPGGTLVVQVAFVAGTGFDGMIENAAHARLAYEGAWHNIDGDPLTGIDRRETPIHGPALNVVIDSCREELSTPIDVPWGGTVWINNDCAQEDLYKTECQYGEDDSLLFRTGVDGKETQIHWTIEDSSVPVLITGFQGSVTRSGVELTWEIFSDEQIKGFRIYRRTEGETTSELINSNFIIPPEERGYIDASARRGQTYHYTLSAIKWDDSELRSHTITITLKAHSLELYQNYPNPFNPKTTIAFTLPERAHANLAIFDLEGKLVKTLINEKTAEGLSENTWDGTDNKGAAVATGIYFMRLNSGGKILTKKMVLLK